MLVNESVRKSSKRCLKGFVILSSLIFDIVLCHESCNMSPSQQQQQQSKATKVTSEEIGKQFRNWILRMKNTELEFLTYPTKETEENSFEKHWIHSCMDKEEFIGKLQGPFK